MTTHGRTFLQLHCTACMLLRSEANCAAALCQRMRRVCDRARDGACACMVYAFTDHHFMRGRQPGIHAVCIACARHSADQFTRRPRSGQWRREACGVDARNLCKILQTLLTKIPTFSPLPRACKKYRKKKTFHALPRCYQFDPVNDRSTSFSEHMVIGLCHFITWLDMSNRPPSRKVTGSGRR